MQGPAAGHPCLEQAELALAIEANLSHTTAAGLAPSENLVLKAAVAHYR